VSYKHKGWLEQKYWAEELSLAEIATLQGVSDVTILKWMRRHRIPRRTLSEARQGAKNPQWGKSHRGHKDPRWKGGRTYDRLGYVLIWNRDHPNADRHGYVYEHRLVMEEWLGRLLTPEEVVHHENEINDDNRIENLRLFASGGEHTAYHDPKKERNKNGTWS